MQKIFYREDRKEREDTGEPATELNKLSTVVIDCCFEVHKTLGQGLLENAYEECLYIELLSRGIKVEKQKPVSIVYKYHRVEVAYRLDLIVEGQIIIETKSVEKIISIHEAQLINYLKLSKCPVGFLVNFNTKMFKDGIKRYVNTVSSRS